MTSGVPGRVAVVGGGLAGIAAALGLAEAGWTPIVIETRGKLGGRATSFVDPRSGLELDNCQHVLMGCCTNLLELYRRLGVLDRIEWHPTVYWADPPRNPIPMKPGLLPAPAHFLGSFRRLRIISASARRAVSRAMWRMLRMGFAGRERWRGRAFSDFLAETGQPAEAIERFWEPVVVSACNAACAAVDATFALQVFQEGFLASRWSPVMGLSTVPLRHLYQPTEDAIRAVGGEVHLGVSAKAMAFERDRLTGVVTDEGFVAASAVISAVPWDRLAKLASATLVAADPRLQRLDRLSATPILGVHLFFDRPVLTTPHLVLPGRATHWLFGKGVDERGLHHVHAVISAAEAWMDMQEAEIAAKVMEDVRWALPAAADATPVEVRSVKEKRATFAPVPGVHAFRPRAAPDLSGLGRGCRNLYLAGDWCDTGWPATMEGAVRSGFAAAAALTGRGGPVADVPPGRLARFLGLR